MVAAIPAVMVVMVATAAMADMAAWWSPVTAFAMPSPITGTAIMPIIPDTKLATTHAIGTTIVIPGQDITAAIIDGSES